MQKKFLVTTALSEIFIVKRKGQKTIRFFCPDCEGDGELLDLNSAVTVFRIGARELLRQIETGAIHSIETTEGHLLICQNSLVSFFRIGKD